MNKTTNGSKIENTKKKFLGLLKDSEANVKDKGIVDRIVYTLKAAQKGLQDISVKDLKDLYDEVKQHISSLAVTPKPVEGALKPKADRKSAKQADTTETTEEEPKAEPKKTTVKSKAKAETKAEATEEAPKAKTFAFEDKYTIKGLGTLQKADQEEFTDLAAFDQASNDDRQIFVLFSWTKKDLRTYEYDPNHVTAKPIERLPDDVDPVQLAYISGDMTFAYGVSVHTEVMYVLRNMHLETLEDGTRVADGMPFAVYELLPEKSKK